MWLCYEVEKVSQQLGISFPVLWLYGILLQTIKVLVLESELEIDSVCPHLDLENDTSEGAIKLWYGLQSLRHSKTFPFPLIKDNILYFVGWLKSSEKKNYSKVMNKDDSEQFQVHQRNIRTEDL